jgi:hypothetical protein
MKYKKRQWYRFGDINAREEGGVFLRLVNYLPDSSYYEWEVIEVNNRHNLTNSTEGKKYSATVSYVTIDDLRKHTKELSSYCGSKNEVDMLICYPSYFGGDIEESDNFWALLENHSIRLDRVAWGDNSCNRINSSTYRVTSETFPESLQFYDDPLLKDLEYIKALFEANNITCAKIKRFKITKKKINLRKYFTSTSRSFCAFYYFEAEITDLTILFDIQNQLNDFLSLVYDAADQCKTIIVRG